MIARLKRLWAAQPVLAAALVIAVAIITFLAVRTGLHVLYWMDSSHHEQPIEPWMTPKYVSLSYDIPQEELAPVLFLEPGASLRGLRMEDIAEQNGVTLEELEARIVIAAKAYHDEQREGRDE